MTTGPDQPQTSFPIAGTARGRLAARRELKRFFRTSLAFSLGLLLTVITTNALLGFRNARQHGRKMIGSEVYAALEAARAPGHGVRTLVLGDSVARQLFRPGTEPREDVRYLTSNYAISVAGQYYLLEQALANCPEAREVLLLLVVESWGHNLGPPFTDDYFCGHFHDLSHVRDIWRLKREVSLSAVHVSRWLLPHLLGENAVRRPQGPLEPTPHGPNIRGRLSPVGGDSLFHVMGRISDEPSLPEPAKFELMLDGSVVVPISGVSRNFLSRMRALCSTKNVRLRVLPGPNVDAQRYHDLHGIYNGQFVYVEPGKFLGDGTHIGAPHIGEVRSRVIAAHGLDLAVRP